MKVLVVEAEEAVLKSAGIMLNKLGYQVGLAPDWGEALRMYGDQGPYDLVLMALKFAFAVRAPAAPNSLMPCSRRTLDKDSLS